MKKHKLGIPYKDIVRNRKLKDFGEVEDEVDVREVREET